MRNALFNAGGWGAAVLLSLIFTPYIVRKLTVEGFGIYALFTSFASYYALFDLGLGQSLIKFVSHHKATGDYAGINRSLNTALCTQLIAGVLTSALLVALADQILRWLIVSPVFWSSARAGLFACSIGFFFSMISGTLSSLLMGLQRYDITSKVGVVRDVLSNLAIVTVLVLGGHLLEVIYAGVFLAVFIFSVYFCITRRVLPEWRISLRIDKESFMQMVNVGIFMFISTLSQSFSLYIMRFVLSAMLGPSAVTYYSVPFRIIVGFAMFLFAGITVLLPFTAQKALHGGREQLQNIYLKAARYSLVLGFPVLALMAIFSRPILTVWMGSDFADRGCRVMSLLCLGSLLSSIGAVPSTIAFGLGHPRLVAGFSLVGMILTAGMAVPLIHWASLTGAGLAVLLASPLWVLFSFYVAGRLLGVNPVLHFHQVYHFHIVAGLPLLAVVLLFQKFRAIHGTTELILYSVCFFTAYYGLIALTKWVRIEEVKQILGAGFRP